MKLIFSMVVYSYYVLVPRVNLHPPLTIRVAHFWYCLSSYSFRRIDENELYGTGRRIENTSEDITLQIEKKEESAGALNAYIYLIIDAQLNIQNGAYVSAVY